jgi:hypothetical protein
VHGGGVGGEKMSVMRVRERGEGMGYIPFTPV